MGEQVTEKQKGKKGKVWLIVILAVLVLGGVGGWLLFGKLAYRSIEIIECYGENSIAREDKMLDAYPGMQLRSGDYVTVYEDSYLRMRLDDDKYVYLEGQALLKLTAEGGKSDSRTVMDLELGTMVTEIEKKLSKNESYVINAPNTTMAIRGTTTVSEVRYALADAADKSFNEYNVLLYLLGEKTGNVELDAEKHDTIAKLFTENVKAKVSSFVQQGKVELTVYEKKTEGGKESIEAVAVPLQAGNGLSTETKDMVTPEVLALIEVQEDGTVQFAATEEASELLRGIELVPERKQAETIEDIVEILETQVAVPLENTDSMQLQIDVSKDSIGSVAEDILTVWKEAEDKLELDTTPTDIPQPEKTETTPTPVTEPEVVVPDETPTTVPEATPTPDIEPDEGMTEATPTPVPQKPEATPTPAPQTPEATPTPAPQTPEVTAPTEPTAPVEPAVTPEKPAPIGPELPTPETPPVTPEKPEPPKPATPEATPTPSPSPTPTPIPEVVDFTYSELSNGTIRLEKALNTSLTDMTVPGYVNGKKVVAASDETFYGCSATLQTLRLREDVDPETNLLPQLLFGASSCMKLKTVYMPLSYEAYLDEMPFDQIEELTITREGDQMVLRLKKSLALIFLEYYSLLKDYL